jgi:hypothetical protein
MSEREYTAHWYLCARNRHLTLARAFTAQGLHTAAVIHVRGARFYNRFARLAREDGR